MILEGKGWKRKPAIREPFFYRGVDLSYHRTKTSRFTRLTNGFSKKVTNHAAAGALLPLFLAPSQLNPYIGGDLVDGPLSPIDYEDGERIIRAYNAAILPAVCNIWLRAREAGSLQKQQLAKAQKAEILTRSLAETGIVALIDEIGSEIQSRRGHVLRNPAR